MPPPRTTTSGEEPPAGLVHRLDLLPEPDAERLLEHVAALPFAAVVMRGQTARRSVAHFGWTYGFDGQTLEPTVPVPGWLLPLRAALADLAGEPPERFEQCLVSRYPPGAGIGWHRDAPAFDAPVLGFSLLGPARLRMRPGTSGRAAWEVALPHRSGYVLGGAARWRWQHQVPPVKALRYAVTFRALRTPTRR